MRKLRNILSLFKPRWFSGGAFFPFIQRVRRQFRFCSGNDIAL